MPRIWRTDSWPIRNGKFHKEVVCVCVCLVREAYSKFLKICTHLTLDSAPIEAFPNLLWCAFYYTMVTRVKKVPSVARACKVITRFLSLLQRSAHLDSLVAWWIWVEQRWIEESYLRYWFGYKSSYDFVFSKHVIFLPLAHEPLLTLQRLKVEHPFDPCPGEC